LSVERFAPRYSAALFDLDGTLIDSSYDLIASVQHALRLVAPEREPPEGDDILGLVGNPLETILQRLGYPCGPKETRLFTDSYRAHYAEHFDEHTRVYPGVTEALARLRESRVRLALVTTKHQAQADFTVSAFGLRPFFDYVHGWAEGRQHKPHPEPVTTALAQLGVEALRAIMVGDSELDIEAARSAGVATCAVTYGFRPAWFLRTLRPDFLISGIGDLLPIVVRSRPALT
jgi:2-phosphoglycolate phosphatase